MGEDIAGSAGLILPGLPLSVLAFGCTSATMLLGEDIVFGQIRSARPGVACTTPITGALAALDCLRAGRIAVLTPYRDDINVAVARYIEDRGLKVVCFGSFNEDNDHKVARTSPQSIRQAVLSLGSDHGGRRGPGMLHQPASRGPGPCPRNGVEKAGDVQQSCHGMACAAPRRRQ